MFATAVAFTLEAFSVDAAIVLQKREERTHEHGGATAQNKHTHK